MKEAFIDKRLRKNVLEMIRQANEIIAEYQANGYRLTLRQLYYQFVSRDLFANKLQNYARLGYALNDGRLSGLVDWDAIEDRTRNLRGTTSWEGPESIIRAAARGFHLDRWKNQPYRVECWVEKEALTGIIERACNPLDVDYFACRGYVSASEQYGASKRYMSYLRNGQKVLVLHLGDHDPSGMDMTRDIQDRLNLLTGFADGVEIRRIALNMSQVDEYEPPPNPAKMSDSRAGKYVEEFGDSSWELDALNPDVIEALITEHVDTVRDIDAWKMTEEQEDEQRKTLTGITDNYRQVEQFLQNNGYV